LGGFGETEVQNLDVAVFGQRDVGRFEITIDDPLLVRGFDC
jgi:hypothetical protein